MGSGHGAVTRAAMARESMAAVVWCDAAERVRLIVDRLPMPSHVAGYLRGYADSLEFNCALGAGADTTAGDVVGSRSGQLAAYICEPPSSASADVEGQRRTIEIAARIGLFTVESWHEDADAYSEKTLIAQTVIHITFLLSAMAIAATDCILSGSMPRTGGH